MEPGGWEDLMDKAEGYLGIDLGSSTDAPGYKRLLAIGRRVKKELDAS